MSVPLQLFPLPSLHLSLFNPLQHHLLPPRPLCKTSPLKLTLSTPNWLRTCLFSAPYSPSPTIINSYGAPPTLLNDNQLPDFAVQRSTAEIYKAGLVQFTLSARYPCLIYKSLSIRASYSAAGKHKRFFRPDTVSRVPYRRFNGTPECFFDCIKDFDCRDVL